MPFTIVRQDITKMKVDAIVNAANPSLLMGGGVCGAVFRAAGADELQAACSKAAPIKTGEATVTPGFRLPAKYVIHAVGPVYNPQNKAQCAALLRSAYTESLKLAAKNRCESIAFPLISSGIYGYPKAEALQRNTAEDYRADRVMFVIITDGAENSSRKYSADKVRQMIEHEKKKYGCTGAVPEAPLEAIRRYTKEKVDRK